MLEQAIPVADKVIDPPWPEEEDLDLFGATREETHAFAAQCLTRRLKVIGLVPVSGLTFFFLAGTFCCFSVIVAA